MIKSSLLLPAHGHAPYILGVKILRTVASEICIPDYYGEKQRNILMDTLKDSPEDFDRVFLSKSLGEHLMPLLRDKRTTPDFKQYVSSINENFETKSSQLKDIVSEGVEAVSLNGSVKTFSHFDFAINTGLPVLSPVDPVFYVFVGEMSEIYRLSPYQSEEMLSDTCSLTDIWLQVESTFNRMFIPRLHSLAYREDQNNNVEKITFTPPLDSPYPLDNAFVALDEKTPIDYGSTLVIFSGTGMDKKRLLSLAASATGTCFTLPDADKEIEIKRVLPSAWNNPNITTVLARSGLGSVWNAVLNKKPIGVLDAMPEDDPEIYHNSQMVEWAGIGKILKNSVEPLVNDLPAYLSRIQEWCESFEKEFGTVDGIKFTANEIKKYFRENV